MVAVFYRDAHVFLYDTIENAYNKNRGMIGWLFYSNELFDMIRDKVDICLVSPSGNDDFIKTDIKTIEELFIKTGITKMPQA